MVTQDHMAKDTDLFLVINLQVLQDLVITSSIKAMAFMRFALNSVLCIFRTRQLDLTLAKS